MEDFDEKEISIIIEEQKLFDDDDCYIQTTYLYINGERIDSNGNHIQAILEHLGYQCNVEYI